MLSTQKRLELEFIAGRISRGEEVSLSDTILIQKWAQRNRSVYEMLRKARRTAMRGKSQGEEDPLGDFLHELNLGSGDPEDYLDRESSIDDLANFFKAPDHLRRD